MNIRKAKKEDYNKICKIARLYSKKIVEPLPKYSKYYVVEENKKIVGCAALEIYSPKIAEIRSVAVLPKYNKKGYGKELIERCLQEVKKKKIYEVFVVTSIPDYFKKIGFDFCQGEKFILFKK